jgi:hypothetical protein
VSNESGREEIYAQTFPEPGGKWQVSNGGGSDPSWRGDGKELYYRSPDQKLMAVEIKTAGTDFQAGVPQALFPIRIRPGNPRNKYAPSPDGQRFVIAAPLGRDAMAPTDDRAELAGGPGQVAGDYAAAARARPPAATATNARMSSGFAIETRSQPAIDGKLAADLDPARGERLDHRRDVAPDVDHHEVGLGRDVAPPVALELGAEPAPRLVQPPALIGDDVRVGQRRECPSPARTGWCCPTRCGVSMSAALAGEATPYPRPHSGHAVDLRERARDDHVVVRAASSSALL